MKNTWLEKLLKLEEAVRKMTSFSANVLGIDDRGTLEVGMKADINIFEPNNVRALATYPNPFVLAEDLILFGVNGKKLGKIKIKVNSSGEEC